MQELQRARRSIDSAADTASLQRAAGEIQALLQAAVAQAPAEPLTRLISTLNDRLTRRVIRLTSAGTQIEAVRWCWIGLGSEGRQEQTLSSDQDNGIIFAESDPDDALREILLLLVGARGGVGALGIAIPTAGDIFGRAGGDIIGAAERVVILGKGRRERRLAAPRAGGEGQGEQYQHRKKFRGSRLHQHPVDYPHHIIAERRHLRAQ